MKTKHEFKVGDVVRLIERKPRDGDWTKLANIQFGQDLIVNYYQTATGGFASVEFKNTDHNHLIHYADQFELKPDVITVLLRRPSDRKSIEKWLADKGYKNDNPNEYYKSRFESRIINVHLAGIYKGKLTYNGGVRFPKNTKQSLLENDEFMRDWFSHKNIVAIKTKPSVKKAITEIEKYI